MVFRAVLSESNTVNKLQTSNFKLQSHTNKMSKKSVLSVAEWDVNAVIYHATALRYVLLFLKIVKNMLGID
jgi:hypothetical protein